MPRKIYAIAFLCFVEIASLNSLSFAYAASNSNELVKLPYSAGQSFVVVQGYDSPPTHIGKDYYAIDFSQNGCDAYRKSAVAASSGKILLAQEDGYNGGYGTQVLIESGETVVSRYAHLIPETIPVAEGQFVSQGQVIGQIGDTGLVVGNDCASHPGTHIHFAMYDDQLDGTFAPQIPEPISGYTEITQGKWYLSDNEFDGNPQPEVLGASTTDLAMINPSIVLPQSQAISSANIFASSSAGGTSESGGVSVAPPAAASASSQENSFPSSTSVVDVASITTVSPSSSLSLAATSTSTSTFTTAIATATFDSNSLTLNLLWPALQLANDATTSIIYDIVKSDSPDPNNSSHAIAIGQTTSTIFFYTPSNNDFLMMTEYFFIQTTGSDGNSSTIAVGSSSLPRWFSIIQSDDSALSMGSWYDDNWYNLGSGFSGVLRSITLEGYIDDQNYFASHLYLDEYLDPNYNNIDKTFTISDSAPFTAQDQKVTIGGLDIPLDIDKHYRLRTNQDYQNRSVILLGTNTTGTAMFDGFYYGIGRIENTYEFYPYLSAIISPSYPQIDSSSVPMVSSSSLSTTSVELNL